MTSHATTIDEVNSVWPRATEKDCPIRASEFDYELAQRISGGDINAFEELYNRYHRRVYSLCLRMTGNVAEAEDLAQEVFIHVYHKIGSFRGESTMTTWLHRADGKLTVSSASSDIGTGTYTIMTQIAAETLGLPIESVTFKLGDSTLPQAPVLDRIALERAIAQLSPGYRAVLILHDVEGYEHHEIAHICGNSIGTSKSQLHKARRRLYQLLGGKGV